MKIFFLSFFVIFFVFWGVFFKLEVEKNDFQACNSFNEINNMYYYDLHRDIPLALKEAVLDNYDDTGLLKIGLCSEAGNNSLGVINITRNIDSLSYKFNKFIFYSFSDKEEQLDIKNKMLFEEENIFSHSFYFTEDYSTIIESFNLEIQDIHISNPEYYMDIQLLNNNGNSPFSILNNADFNYQESFLKIKIFYSNFAEQHIKDTNNNLLNFSFKNTFKNKPKKDKTYSTEGDNIKIRSTKIKINSSEDLNFINLYLQENFNVTLGDNLNYLKHNLNINLGFDDQYFIIDVFYKHEERIFEVIFSYEE
jgi:hypothetical protein